MKVDILKISNALSDPIRQHILSLILSHERGEYQGCCNSPDEGVCNCDLVDALGLLQSRVSYHMKELVETGVVVEDIRGKWKFYFINRDVLKAYVEAIKTHYGL